MVNFKRLVQAGRVALISRGPHARKVAVIVEIIDQNRVLVDGPCTSVPRQPIGLKDLHLTHIHCQLPHGCGTTAVRKVWERDDLTSKWLATAWAKKLGRKALRAKMSDFDRFKVMVARQQRNRILKSFRIKRPVDAPRSIKKSVKAK
ncbi:Large subunit ribosomal protein L14e cytoplasmic [Fasciolopsis buskii]|uniref:Large ribosomal subunit protein eL14 n=1 Tax=Fasciolopsis buskii TaxID=27845 RepID=A0A8E0VLC5_9TREM|nr:Large subunit ribosomal protein L14e cytoplasmic [Fasciolopsis buski]